MADGARSARAETYGAALRHSHRNMGMTRSHPLARLGTAVFTAVAATILVAGIASAHPESEGDHAGSCIVTVEPGSVVAGGKFTVAGNFGGAAIFLVKGTDASPAENAVPDATTPAGSSFTVTFTAETTDVGSLTVWGLIPGSECGDADALTVSAALPDTAVELPDDTTVLAGVILVLVGVTVVGERLGLDRS